MKRKNGHKRLSPMKKLCKSCDNPALPSNNYCARCAAVLFDRGDFRHDIDLETRLRSMSARDMQIYNELSHMVLQFGDKWVLPASGLLEFLKLVVRTAEEAKLEVEEETLDRR